MDDVPKVDPHTEVFTVRTTDRYGRPLGGARERDGRLLAAAQGIDLTEGSCDNGTREYWYRRADDAREQLAAYERAGTDD